MKETVHDNENPMKDKKQIGISFTLREYAVIQVALHQFIATTERQFKRAQDPVERAKMGVASADMAGTVKLLEAAREAFGKFETHGIGISRDLLQGIEKQAEREVRDSVRKAGYDPDEEFGPEHVQ